MACAVPAMSATTPETDAVRAVRRLRRRSFATAALIALPWLPALLLPLAWPLAVPARLALLLAALPLSLALAWWHARRQERPLRTLAIQIEALREGDYTLRGVARGALAPVVGDLNALAASIQRERLGYEEASHLLVKTLAALDSAVLVFDGSDRLSLANPAAQRLLAQPATQLFGRSAAALGVDALLATATGSVVAHAFAGHSGRFEVRHATLRQEGRDGVLLVINDVDRVLRSEERQAWQRLLRVLGHEVNNSLAPIQSIADTLATLLQHDALPADWRADMGEGLALIARRSAALARFLSSYGKLARLPAPQRAALDLAAIAAAVVRLQADAGIVLEGSDALPVLADADQIEQALINLLRNALDAQDGRGAGICVRCTAQAPWALVEILDNGPGPPTSDNLFVPFFTTKPGGSGIGLVLARQIAEAHGGELSLLPRAAGAGACARLRLPLR